MKKKIILLSLIFLCLISCETTYYYQYETLLKGSTKQELSFEDEYFYFNFLPRPDGIIFLISNKTNKPAYLIWDKSYFIEPNGNSVKALNTDLLESSSRVAIKENQESILPQHAKFCRFTTAITNFQTVNYSQATSLSSTYLNNYFSLSNSNTLFSSFSASVAKNYWPAEVRRPIGAWSLENEGKELTDYIKQNDNMGLGIYIKQDEKIYEYRFDFKFKRLNVYKNKLGTQDKYIIMFAEKDKWNWNVIEQQGPNLNRF